jgi:ribose transport system ATP-binding protein
MIMHEPVGGVDVGAKAQLFGHIHAAAEKGLAVIVLSADNLDLADLCDRVLVMRDGRVTAELAREGLSENSIFEASMRVDVG